MQETANELAHLATITASDCSVVTQLNGMNAKLADHIVMLTNYLEKALNNPKNAQEIGGGNKSKGTQAYC